jgi:hypothetical protein
MAALQAEGRPLRAIAEAVRGEGVQDQPRGREGRPKGKERVVKLEFWRRLRLDRRPAAPSRRLQRQRAR